MAVKRIKKITDGDIDIKMFNISVGDIQYECMTFRHMYFCMYVCEYVYQFEIVFSYSLFNQGESPCIQLSLLHSLLNPLAFRNLYYCWHRLVT